MIPNVDQMEKRHILIVDDEENMLQSMQFILEAANFRVSLAKNGEEALEKILAAGKAKKNYDLLITDIQMPGVTGVELVRKLSQLEVEIPILVLSSYGCPNNFNSLQGKEALVYVDKPVEDDALLSYVTMLMKPSLSPAIQSTMNDLSILKQGENLMKIKNILVPVDFSQFSDKSVEYALFLAESYQAHITLMHAVLLFLDKGDANINMETYKKLVEDKEKEVRKQLAAHLKSAENSNVSISTEIRKGFSAADTILDFIAENDLDLVVMGTHGHTGLKQWIYGSVAEKVVRMSPAPVLTTHHLQKTSELRKILVPVDFSTYSSQAVKIASSLASNFNAELHLLHIIEQQIHPSFYASNIESLFVLDPDLKKRSNERLKTFHRAEVSKKMGGNAEKDAAYHVLEGRIVYQEILEYAKESDIDLIVMGTRGLTGLDHWLVGSTAERVVRLAEIPVLTVARHNE